MAIFFFSEDVNPPAINKSKVKSWLKEEIEGKGKKVGDLNMVFCSDEFLLQYNKQYLNHDYYTDIITFDYTEGVSVSGDLFISTERVMENAQLNNKSYEEELLRVMIHGVLHILGHGDKGDAESAQMRLEEEKALKRYNK